MQASAPANVNESSARATLVRGEHFQGVLAHIDHPGVTGLANELVEAPDEMVLAKTISRYGRVDLLCIDELGYMQRRGAPLSGPDRTRGEELRPAHLERILRGLDQDLHRPRLCAAIVDRHTFGGNIIETGTDS